MPFHKGCAGKNYPINRNRMSPTGTASFESFARLKHRAGYWYRMFAGTSYYHLPQGLGKVFVPGQLRGYFNDLSGKARWEGEVAENGLPLSKLSSGRLVHFPILLCQKALGHWDLWLRSAEAEHRQAFLDIAGWLVRAQDSNGGWDTWGAMGQPDQYRYSAMTQGEALSVLVRANALKTGVDYANACHRAVKLMQRSVEGGGVCGYRDEDVFLEEFPSAMRDTVLNGWIFALFGLYDYLLHFEDEQVSRFYSCCVTSLVRHLPDFDAGYWSYYSSGTRRLASPFYHRLHLSQLHALSQIWGDPLLKKFQERWASQERNRFFKAWAIVSKGAQKLREPAEVTILS